jgi:hypothetical protein
MSHANIIASSAQVSGRFKLTKTCNGIITGETDWIGNLILNSCLDGLCTTGQDIFSACSYLSVGTGSTTPVATNVALVNRLATTTGGSATSANIGVDPWYSYTYKTFTFAQGAVVGNVAELGMGTAANGSGLWTRALIKDSSGNPTTFSVFSNETLSVVYEIRYYPIIGQQTGTVVISGVTYNYTKQSAQISGQVGVGLAFPVVTHVNSNNIGKMYETSVLPTQFASISGTPQDFDSYALATYATGSFYRDETVIAGPTTGNFSTGIGSMLLGKYLITSSLNGGYQIAFTPKIPKNNLQSLTLVHRLSVGRYPS